MKYAKYVLILPWMILKRALLVFAPTLASFVITLTMALFVTSESSPLALLVYLVVLSGFLSNTILLFIPLFWRMLDRIAPSPF